MPCLRCAGAPRQPASGSGLSLSILSWHAALNDPGEFGHRHGSGRRCRHGLRRDLNSSALPLIPQSVSRGARISGLPGSLALQPVRLLAPLRRIRPGLPSHRGLLLPGFQQVDRPSCRWISLQQVLNSFLLAGLPPARMAASLAAPDPDVRLSRIKCGAPHFMPYVANLLMWRPDQQAALRLTSTEVYDKAAVDMVGSPATRVEVRSCSNAYSSIPEFWRATVRGHYRKRANGFSCIASTKVWHPLTLLRIARELLVIATRIDASAETPITRQQIEVAAHRWARRQRRRGRIGAPSGSRHLFIQTAPRAGCASWGDWKRRRRSPRPAPS